jgi:KUP system potassium uptake protein
MGHCGRKIFGSVFVKITLVLNYFGQAAYLIHHEGETLTHWRTNGNPFYLIMADWFQPIGIIIATLAAVIASQALISGSFTLINEAMRLNFWPKVKNRISYRGERTIIHPLYQLWFFGCVGIVLHFEESGNMEHAYGLAIILCMIMTTILLNFYLIMKKKAVYHHPCNYHLPLIELSFLVANITKFAEGGYVTLIVLISIMTIWYLAKQINKSYTKL